jgi:hypothetical protein
MNILNPCAKNKLNCLCQRTYLVGDLKLALYHYERKIQMNAYLRIYKPSLNAHN